MKAFIHLDLSGGFSLKAPTLDTVVRSGYIGNSLF